MEYRPLGRTGMQVSAIALGTEHLQNQPKQAIIEVIHEALDLGINYFDLFPAQPDFRDAMGAAFAGRRDRALLGAHLGSIHCDGQYEASRDLALSEHFFHDFLTRYDTDYVDVLFLHNSDGQEDYDVIMQGGLHAMARRLQSEGKARAVGLSCHTLSTALQAATSGAIYVLMFPISLAGHAVEGKRALLEACALHGVGLVAMKPFAGGRLLQTDEMLDLDYYAVGGPAQQLRRTRTTTVTQCLAYVLSQPGVSCVVPGCRNVAQLHASWAYWQASEAERDFSGVMAAFQQVMEGECVYCNHCLPCPALIDIGQMMHLLDEAERLQAAAAVGQPRPAVEALDGPIGLSARLEALRAAYRALPALADACLQCGACSERCPFGVDPMLRMERAVELLG